MWMLGRRSHHRRLRREVGKKRAVRVTLFGRAVEAWLPWKARDYPGEYRFLSKMLGVSEGYARNLLHGARLPAHHAERVATLLEGRAERDRRCGR